METKLDLTGTFEEIKHLQEINKELLEACYTGLARLKAAHQVFYNKRFTDRHGDAERTSAVIDAMEAIIAKAEGRE